MLERWAPECFPENEQGQVHFARALMESAAEEIRKAWADAVAEIASPATLPARQPMKQEEAMKTREDLIEVMARGVAASYELVWEELAEGARDYMLNDARTALTAIEAAGCVVVPKVATEEMWRAMWPKYHPHEGRTTPEQRPEGFAGMKTYLGHYLDAFIAASPYR